MLLILMIQGIGEQKMVIGVNIIANNIPATTLLVLLQTQVSQLSILIPSMYGYTILV